MLEIIFAGFAVCSFFSIWHYLKEKFDNLLLIIKSKRSKDKTKQKQSINIKGILRKIFKEIFVITDIKQLGLVLCILSLSIIFGTPVELRKHFFIKIIIVISFIILFVGVAIFLTITKENKTLGSKISDYISKLAIFESYATIFLMAYLSKLDSNELFVLALLGALVYSVCFLKYIIDEFQYFIILVVHLIFIYLFIILLDGFTFGIFYSNNFDIYSNLFKNIDIKLVENVSINSYIEILNIGLKYFYTYPDVLNSNDTFKNCVPLFQYLFGVTFNVAIIGFFISYTASKAFSKNEKTYIECKEKNLNYINQLFEELKKRKFKVNVKKDD